MDAGCSLALELALQTTLLGLAIAVILALVAALVGPLLLDWGSHRTLFEAEASRLIGSSVRRSIESPSFAARRTARSMRTGSSR